MRNGKTTHNIFVTPKEYLELKRKYPTGKYNKTENHSWFTLTVENVDVLSGKNNFSIEVIFWREEE